MKVEKIFRIMKEIIKKNIPKILLNWYHFILAFLGALIYWFPSRKLKVIGVTGTKGKTTTVILAGKILEEAGFKVGWISSATLKIDRKEWLNPYHMTMPGRFFIQKFLKEMVKNHCQYALIEVTSEGILQHRQKFINFGVAVFTNLAPEHIEAHGSFENYRAMKGKLFQATKEVHIINANDKNANYFLQFPAKIKYQFKRQNGKCKIIVQNSKLQKELPEFLLNLKLLGDFNIDNALAAICVGLSQGVSIEVCQKALEKIKGIPGRLEIIDEGQNFKVIIDTAHTPDSFEKVFELVNNLPHNKIISVFGAPGGGRDKWKRPVLGEIAQRYSHQIILTNDDPYDEDPIEIVNQIEKGIKSAPSSVLKILDRREAIKKALQLAQPQDIVLILGKGAEQVIIMGSKKIPWDDREVVREELKKLKNDY